LLGSVAFRLLALSGGGSTASTLGGGLATVRGSHGCEGACTTQPAGQEEGVMEIGDDTVGSRGGGAELSGDKVQGDQGPLGHVAALAGEESESPGGGPADTEAQKCVSFERLEVEGADGGEHDCSLHLLACRADAEERCPAAIPWGGEDGEKRLDHHSHAKIVVPVRGEQLFHGDHVKVGRGDAGVVDVADVVQVCRNATGDGERVASQRRGGGSQQLMPVCGAEHTSHVGKKNGTGTGLLWGHD